MKSGFVIISVLIPVYNVLVMSVAAFGGWNILFAILPCIVGSAVLTFMGYKGAILPFLDDYEAMEQELKEAKQKDRERSDFIKSVSEAYKAPTETITVAVKELKNLGVDKMVSGAGAAMPVEEKKPEKKYIEFDDDPFELRPKKVPEPDKSQRIDPTKYSGEIVKRRIGELDVAADKLNRLSDDIIAFSEVQTKSHVAQGGKVNVEKALDKVLEEMGDLASRYDQTIEVEVEDGIYIEGVEERFVALVKRLVENAIIYSRKGSTVHITADNVSGYVFVNVRDEGFGIPAADQEKIFERFYRVKRLEDPNPTAAGLGLAIVKHLAELMDAEVKVKSAPGQGSTFSVIFKRGLV